MEYIIIGILILLVVLVTISLFKNINENLVEQNKILPLYVSINMMKFIKCDIQCKCFLSNEQLYLKVDHLSSQNAWERQRVRENENNATAMNASAQGFYL